MNKEITPEIRQRIFALYWGQTILSYYGVLHTVNAHHIVSVSEFWNIEVKKLSSITDEDAKECARISEEESEDAFVWGRHYASSILSRTGHYSGYCYGESRKLINLIDFLRSKGYALPVFGYSVEQLEKEGIFKLI